MNMNEKQQPKGLLVAKYSQLLPCKKRKDLVDITKLGSTSQSFALSFRLVALVFLVSVLESIFSVSFIKHLSLTTSLLHFPDVKNNHQRNSIIPQRPGELAKH